MTREPFDHAKDREQALYAPLQETKGSLYDRILPWFAVAVVVWGLGLITVIVLRLLDVV